ncbi:MAG: hypothetical protein HQM15_07410 [Deltaproteobacteria bacterium]|nr:hypothetical protein [Deltaproteobacteria bacterium]
MKKIIFVFLLFLSACGSSASTNSPSLSTTHAPTQYSLEAARSCLQQSDLGCASENYCALKYQNPSDATAGLSCCVSKFLQILSNENTQRLSSFIGYNPLRYEELQGQSPAYLLANKKIIFGELFLKSSSQSTSLGDLAVQWGTPLLGGQIATEDLNTSLRQLGSDLAEVQSCLASEDAYVNSNVSIEGLLFGMNQKIEITPKDFRFAKFATGLLAYGFQGVFSYDWGFDKFPSWPLSPNFYRDINGQLSASDTRFGDLDSQGASRIVSKADLLRSAFNDWDTFVQSPLNGSLTDRWIAWRLAAGDEQNYKKILNTVSDSITLRSPQPITGEGTIVNFSALFQETSLPSASNIPEELNLLSADSSQNPAINWDYIDQLLKPLIQ